MTKRITVLFFLILVFALWRNAGPFTFGLFNSVVAQKTRPAPINYSKFKHSSHDGNVKSLTNKTQSFNIDCAYCHGTAVKDKQSKDQHDIETMGYPSHKNGTENEKTHSACTDCHSFTGNGFQRDMCVICHDKLTLNPKQMATNIRSFPNPDGGPSQFYDFYSHSEHVDFYDQFALKTPLKDRIKFFDPKKDAKENKGLDKSKFECVACHNNQSQVTAGKMNFASGVKQTTPGHPECFVCHLDPKIVTPPKKDKPDPKNSFATNCTGCHRATGKPMKDDRPIKGSELSVHWFTRQIVNTEFNPVIPGVKPALPYNHKTHDEAVGKTVQDCLSCHTTGKTANTLGDFYLQERKTTKEKQPLIWSCVDCHKKEMQTKIEGAVTLESAKCNYCHALKTVREFNAKGVALPPPNHFYKKAPAAPSPTPTPKTEASASPAPKPTPTPVTKAEATLSATSPTPAPAPTPAATATPVTKAETPATNPKAEETPAATPTPAPAQTSTSKAETAPTPTPPTPAPAPTPTATVTPTPTPTPKGEAAAASPSAPTPSVESAKAEAAKPEPAKTEVAKPEPAKTEVAKTEVAATPTPPTPSPAPTPVAAAASNSKYKQVPSRTGGQPQMMPKMMRLGDPKDNPSWGKSDKWGVVENFDHDTHITPKYSKRCEDCHHTNQDSRKEMMVGMVPLCTSCHKEKGHQENPNNKENEEIDVELAYHGNPNNLSNNAGCIECHKRFYNDNPDADRKAPTSKCSGCHAEKQARLERLRNPFLRDQWLVEELFSMIRTLRDWDQSNMLARQR